ncbi:MAG: MarR family winged helix-turn-helix transcriptional regulator, partial [Gemmatimonadales bacterium]
FVLQVVREAGSATINEVAERTYTDQSSVSVIVSRLARAGLVTRERSSKDGRRVQVALTPAGNALLDGAPPTVQTRLIEALGNLPAGRRKALATELTALAATVESTRGPAGMFFDDHTAPAAPRRKTRVRIPNQPTPVL